jgi:hypothetical protein
VSSIKYGTSLEVDEMNEKMNKTKSIEHIVNQMSSNTNTHHTYNNYHFKPSPDTPDAGVDPNIDEKLDKEKFHSAQEVYNHEERRKAKRDQNTETVKAHLKSTVTQTEAEAAANTYASNIFYPPDDDRFYSASSVSKKVRGRAKKVPVSSVRPNSVQVDELKRMNAEMKKMLEETINNQKAKPDDPMNEFATPSNPKPPGDGGGSRIKTKKQTNVAIPVSAEEVDSKERSRSPPDSKSRKKRKEKTKPNEIKADVKPKIRDRSRTPSRNPKEKAKSLPTVLKTIDEEVKKRRGRPKK